MGSSLTATAGDAFHVTGTTGNTATASITVKGGTTISAGTGRTVYVDNSSTASFAANGETLSGNLYADSTSTITASLQNGTILTGMTNRVAMTIDSTSTWSVIAGSVLTSLANSGSVAFKATALTDTISGSYTQASSGVLNILLGDASIYDQLAVTGAANLGGVLDLELVNGFVPIVGETFDIITRGGHRRKLRAVLVIFVQIGFS